MDIFVKALETVAAYGPFPFGVLVGILLTKQAYAQALKLNQEERDANREERNGQMKLVAAMQDRIDKLHQINAGQSGKNGGC